jgi:hypothetical protein
MCRDQMERRIVRNVSVGQAERAKGTPGSRVWRSNVIGEKGQAEDLLRATVVCM